MLLLALLLQLAGSRLEARTPTVEKVLDEFRTDWTAAKVVVASGVDATLDFPDAELYIGEQRAIARTCWTGFELKTEGDWRALMQVEPAVRRHVAIHEACHLADGERLKAEAITPELRHVLEMKAEMCYVMYEAAQR